MKFSGKILLVDDEAHIRKFVCLILKRMCLATVLEAPDGQTALEIYQKELPDLMLLDINMPNLDGLQTLEKLREIAPEANVVMLTSLANRKTVEECERLGALGYIRKDSTREELTAELEQIMLDCIAPEQSASSDPLSA